MAKLSKKLKQFFDNRYARRRKVKELIDTVATSPVAGSIVQDIINNSQGAHKVKYDPSIANRKGFEEGKKTTLAVVVAGAIFAVLRSNFNLDPTWETPICAVISLVLTGAGAYLKMRLQNKKKIKEMEE